MINSLFATEAASKRNLKQIALGMHKYYDVHKTFPTRADFHDNGQALLSWRVHLLPFLDQMALHQQFHLSEPWDSRHNKALIKSMPDVYLHPASSSLANTTNYLVPAGPGSIFESQEGTSIARIVDGRHNTILVLEVNDRFSVIWTKPQDFDYEPENPLAGLGTNSLDRFNAAFADGSVRSVAMTINPEMFLRMLMMADRQPNCSRERVDMDRDADK